MEEVTQFHVQRPSASRKEPGHLNTLYTSTWHPHARLVHNSHVSRYMPHAPSHTCATYVPPHSFIPIPMPQRHAPRRSHTHASGTHLTRMPTHISHRCLIQTPSHAISAQPARHTGEIPAPPLGRYNPDTQRTHRRCGLNTGPTRVRVCGNTPARQVTRSVPGTEMARDGLTGEEHTHSDTDSQEPRGSSGSTEGPLVGSYARRHLFHEAFADCSAAEILPYGKGQMTHVLVGICQSPPPPTLTAAWAAVRVSWGQGQVGAPGELQGPWTGATSACPLGRPVAWGRLSVWTGREPGYKRAARMCMCAQTQQLV